MAATRRTTRTTARRGRAPAPSFESLRDQAIGVVETAVRQGTALQGQARRMALAKARAARRAVIAGAREAQASTRKAVSRLERVFEQRVSRAIGVLGVPSAADVRALSRQVAELQQSVEKLRRSRARA